MGMRYLRGPTPNNAGVADGTNDFARTPRGFNLMLFYFFRYILGYTYVEQNLVAGSTWTFDGAHTKSGSDGVLTNTDYTFSSAGGSFAVGDVGKFLVVIDPTNESNSGIYEIATFVGATQVTINFYAGGGAFPTAASGLQYYVIAGDDAGDPRVGDEFILEVPHATSPYTARFIWVGNTGQNGNAGMVVEVCPEASAWDTIGHDWEATARDRLTAIKISRGHVNNAHGRLFAAGHTDGSHWLAWSHHNNGAGNKQGAGVSVLTALDPTPTPDPSELVYAWGNTSGASDNSAWERFTLNGFDGMTFGTMWSENGGFVEDAYMMGWWNSSLGYDHFRGSFASPNQRTGQRDALPIWVVKDPTGDTQNWGPWGELPTASIVVADAVILGEHASFDSDLWLHIRDGLVTSWPGIPYA